MVADRRRALVVQRTGWGKSAVYFIATRLLRDAGAGPTLLISPLLALMRNQLEMAERAGVRATTINSENRDDWDAIEERVRNGDVDTRSSQTDGQRRSRGPMHNYEERRIDELEAEVARLRAELAAAKAAYRDLAQSAMPPSTKLPAHRG